MRITGKQNLHTMDSMKIESIDGFSLFELVVFIISVAIIYAYAANRFTEFPAQAERANFTAILAQLQTGINLELMFGMSGGPLQNPQLLEGINPMDLMLSPPTNYLGAFNLVDINQLPRRSWYFDQIRNELVYLVNDATDLYLELDGSRVATDILRFKVSTAYRQFDPTSGLDAVVADRSASPVNEKSLERRFGGVLLQPVVPYIWNSADTAELITDALATSNQ